MPENFNPIFEAVGCFIEHSNNILLLMRRDEKPEGNTWALPSGKKDLKENAEYAMLREIKEETGYIIPKNQLVYVDEYYVRYSLYDFAYHIFNTRVGKNDIQLNKAEHKGYLWITPKEALILPLIEDLDSCINLFYNI